MKRITIINGPNLNFLGTRNPAIYGSDTLESLEKECLKITEKFQLEFFQSNHEGEIIDKIYDSKDAHSIIINAGALSHTSIAIRDAIEAIGVDTYEVHISQIYKRENFRHFSYISGIAKGVVIGMGIDGYLMILNNIIRNNDGAR